MRIATHTGIGIVVALLAGCSSMHSMMSGGDGGEQV